MLEVFVARLCGTNFSRNTQSPLAHDDHFWMFSPERLGDMAAPADRLVGRKQFWKLLRPEVVPLHRDAVRSHEGRGMIEMMEPPKALLAIHTLLSLIPIGHNVPDQAVLRIGLNLLQTLLTAILALRPARALIQAKSRFTDEGPCGRFRRCHIHRHVLECLRAGYKPLAPVSEI